MAEPKSPRCPACRWPLSKADIVRVDGGFVCLACGITIRVKMPPKGPPRR